MSSEVIKEYDQSILDVASEYGEAARRVASALDLESQGVSSSIINGVILEEYQDRNESLTDQGLQLLGDALSSKFLGSHDDIKKNYEHIKSLPPMERAELTQNLLEKSFNPIMLDVGRGNIQTYTAIRLLEEYNETYKDSDPLALKHYNDDYSALAADLQKDLSPTSVKIAGLMVKEAVDWGEGHVQNWDDLNGDEKEGFASYYYNVGQDYINDKYESAVNDPALGGYNVDIENTNIAQEYILNKENIIKSENTSDLTFSVLQSLIANDAFSENSDASEGKGKLPTSSGGDDQFGGGWSAADGDTHSDTYDHEIDVDTSFTHGNTEQETSTSEEVAADVQSGNVYNTGNASVNSSTANDSGTWSIVNTSVTEGIQPRWAA